jgi:hypothetical protein
MIRNWWILHHTTFLRLAIVLMAVLALLKLGTEFWRLLLDTGPNGAKDLRYLHELVYRWFTGRHVYSDLKTAVYPPASYVILWPLLGWLAVTPARWLWAVTSAGALVALAYLTVRKSGAETPLERAFVVLMLLSMNATGVTIGNGQLILHLLPLLITGLCMAHRIRNSWVGDLLIAGLVLVTLVKPSVTVPFLWIILIYPSKLRLALLISSGYIALTFFAGSFQDLGLLRLLQEWLASASAEAVKGGYADFHIWLSILGLKEWILPASLLMLAALGGWTYRYREMDLWLLLAVSALVARLWTYHRLYDNLLLLLPEVALFRITKQERFSNGDDLVAGVLLGLVLLVMLAPARLLIYPSPWDWVYKAGQPIIWIGVLIFLLNYTHRQKYEKVH